MNIKVMRATETWQQAGAYYVRIQAMAKQYHITLREEFDEHDTPDTKYIVLLDGDFPVATCRLYELPEDEAELPTMMFGRIVVLPEYRKHGLGRLIVTEAEKWARELGCKKVPVIAVAEHDTASAVAATPSDSDDFVYISCGTWSLFGIECKEPILTEEAARLNFTNEGGYNNTVRFLKNIMGLWLIQESRRQWRREGEDVGFDQLEREALGAKPFQCFIDVDDPAFETAGNLPRRVREFCTRTGQYVPETRGEVMRCIYESLAMKYKYTFNMLSRISGRKYKRINILGGGIKDKLLCQMASDACRVEVLAGPSEATVMGNIAVVYAALGEIKDFAEIRKAVAASTELKRYVPQSSDEWDKAYAAYLRIIEQ